jgi:ribonuclease T2
MGSCVCNKQLGRVMHSNHRMAALAGFIFAIFLTATASAQDRRQNQPGEFDFYVLALSWSPSFCEAAEERSPGRVPAEQCGERPYSFVVHGLWPQYEQGFPEYCQQPPPKLNRTAVSSMLDLMPSPRLIFNAWRKHGTCAGFSAGRYFEEIRKARALVKIPDEYLEASTAREVAPAEVEEAFLKANPNLSAGGISVTCDSKRVNEVRVCLTKDLQFRDCPELERRSCKRPKLAMPAVRVGGFATAR